LEQRRQRGRDIGVEERGWGKAKAGLPFTLQRRTEEDRG
jgi:hypothetical protein